MRMIDKAYQGMFPLGDNRFIMVVKSDNAGTSGTDQFTIPTTGAGYLYNIKTSDGYTATGVTGNHTITFPSGAGTREVYITGNFPRIFFNNVGDKLKVLQVTNWGNYGVSQADQSNAFFGCTNLTSIADNGAWFDVVINGTSMFLGNSLTSLPAGMELPLLTNGASMFRDNSLTSLPAGMELPLLTNGTLMFRDNSLTSLPAGMELPLLSVGASMFLGNSLTSLPSGMELPALTNGTSMFLNNSITSLPVGMTLPVLSVGTSMFLGNTINTTRYSQLLVDLESGNANNSVTFHGGNSKYNATGETARDILTASPRLWSITDGGVDNRFIMVVKSDNTGTSGTDQFTIPTTGGGYLYDIETSDGYTATGVTGNHTITFPSGAGTREVYITGDFPRIYFNNGGDRLKVLQVTNWGTYGVVSGTNQTSAFRGCTNLTSIVDGGAWFDIVTTGTQMFLNCTLTSLPTGMELPALTSGSSMFLSNSLTSLPTGMELPLLTGGGSMFFGNSLTSLPTGMELPLLTNGNNMFRSNSLTSLPTGMELPALTIGNNMFRDNSLTSLPTGMELPLLTNGSDMLRGNAVTDLPAGMTLPALTSGASMFLGNTINTTRYSQLLVDLESGNANNSVTFHGGFSKYNASGQVARNILTGATRLWTITDGGLE